MSTSSSLLTCLLEERKFYLLHFLKDCPIETRAGELSKLFLTVVSYFQDDEAAGLIPLILLAIDNANEDEALARTVPGLEEELAGITENWKRQNALNPHRTHFKEIRAGARFENLLGLYKQLPPEQEYPLLIKTRRILIQGILEEWARADDSNERAHLYWEQLFLLPLYHQDSGERVSYKYNKLLAEALREATDRNVPMARLDRVLIRLSEDEKQVLRDFPILRERQGDLEDVLRVLLIARARNVKVDRVRQEIPVLSSVEGVSGPAYTALLNEARKIAAQDATGQKLLALVTGRTPGLEYSRDDQIGGVVSLEFPDRHTIVVKILWDTNDWSNRVTRRPEDKVLHHWVEIVLDRATIWRKGYNTDHSPSMKVVVRLFTCKWVCGDDPKKEELFREEVVK